MMYAVAIGVPAGSAACGGGKKKPKPRKPR